MLKAARNVKNLTQKELSRLTGISQSYISKLENDKFNAHSPTLRQIVKLSKELNLCPINLCKWFLDLHMECSNNCLKLQEPIICKKLLIKKF